MHNQHWFISTRFSPFSAPWRKIVPKFSAALNPLTITQLACERPQGRLRTVLHGPAHQLAVRRRIIISNNNNHGMRPDIRYVTLPLSNSSLLHLLRRGFSFVLFIVVLTIYTNFCKFDGNIIVCRNNKIQFLM